MKVGSTDEFLLLLHFVPVLFTTITFFPWHYKTFCQISRSRVSSINYRPKMTFDDAGAKADQEFDLMKDPGVQSQDRHLLFCPPSLPPLPNKFRRGPDQDYLHRAGRQVYGGQQGGHVGKINAVYEARAVPEDHAMADKEKMFIFGDTDKWRNCPRFTI